MNDSKGLFRSFNLKYTAYEKKMTCVISSVFPQKCKTFQKGICNACHIFSYTSYWPDMSWGPWEHRCHCIQTTLITLGFLQPQCLHVTVGYDCSCSLQWGHFAHENSETQKLWDRPFSPLLFSNRTWKKNSWHINFIQCFAFEPCFGNNFLSKLSMLCFSVQWNLLSICSLTFFVQSSTSFCLQASWEISLCSL